MNRNLRRAVKKVVSKGLFYSGACSAALLNLNRRLLILTYHSFTNGSPVPLLNRMPAPEFERQIIYLKKHCQIVSLSEGLELTRDDHTKLRQRKPYVAITIDDGFSDNYDVAFPVLGKHNIPATIFLCTDFVDTGRVPWPTQIVDALLRTRRAETAFPFHLDISTDQKKGEAAETLKHCWSSAPAGKQIELLNDFCAHLGVSRTSHLFPLTWDEVREMNESGIEIGSHTAYHSILPNVDKESKIKELALSKRRIEEELKKNCSYFSYPDGAWDQSSRLCVIEGGFQTAVTQDWGYNDAQSDWFALKRIEIPFYEGIETFACRVSLLFRPHKRDSR